MDPVPLIGRYPYSHWVLGAHPGGIESYRVFPQLGVLPCDHGNMGGSPWLLCFITVTTFRLPFNDKLIVFAIISSLPPLMGTLKKILFNTKQLDMITKNVIS